MIIVSWSNTLALVMMAAFKLISTRFVRGKLQHLDVITVEKLKYEIFWCNEIIAFLMFFVYLAQKKKISTNPRSIWKINLAKVFVVMLFFDYGGIIRLEKLVFETFAGISYTIVMKFKTKSTNITKLGWNGGLEPPLMDLSKSIVTADEITWK